MELFENMYFQPTPIFDEKDFEHMFGMPRIIFYLIYNVGTINNV